MSWMELELARQDEEALDALMVESIHLYDKLLSTPGLQPEERARLEAERARCYKVLARPPWPAPWPDDEPTDGTVITWTVMGLVLLFGLVVLGLTVLSS